MDVYMRAISKYVVGIRTTTISSRQKFAVSALFVHYTFIPSVDKPDYVISSLMMNSEKPRLLKYLHCH